MARIFQKYVTPEGRSLVPPGDEPEVPKEEPKKVDDSLLRKKGGPNAVSLMSVLADEKKQTKELEQEETVDGMESVKPILAVLVGIRSIIQSLHGMTKVNDLQR